MRFIKFILVLLYAVVYAYSAYMTGKEPQRIVWGYICVIVFMVFTIWGVIEFTKLEQKNKKPSEEEKEEN